MAQPTERYDFIVIGAGIAGASAAYELAGAGASVLVLEAETAPGYHATGRSAAVFCESRGNPVIQALARASRPFFDRPPKGFGGSGARLLTPRPALHVATIEQLPALQFLFAQLRPGPSRLELHDGEFARQRVPALRPDVVSACLWDPNAQEIDVHGLLQGYVKGSRHRGAKLEFSMRVTQLRRIADGWVVACGEHRFEGSTIVNAAGAWADAVADLAGASQIGLEPRKRNACIVAPSACGAVRNWSVVFDVGGQFYFKPDVDRLLVSPEDEIPSEPCDAHPDAESIALGVHRVQQVAELEFRTKPVAAWAGLRSFVRDEGPVVGFDPQVEGLFWIAGQGGSGIKTAPAIARLAAALATHRSVPGDLDELGMSVRDLSPQRLTAPAPAT